MPNHVRSLANNTASGIEPHSTTVTILQTTFQAASAKSSSAAFYASISASPEGPGMAAAADTSNFSTFVTPSFAGKF